MILLGDKANTVSKRTKTRSHMAHVTKEFHRVHPKWFLSIWYVRHKPCTYLASRLALSPNGLYRASTWASSPRSIIGCVQKWFLSLWYVWHKPCTYLAPTITPPPNGPKWDSTWPKSPSSYIGCVKMIFETVVRSAQSVDLCWSRLALSLNGLNQATTWATSPRSTIRCVQNDFWAYGMLGVNRAIILRQD
jgi:hypothetical protein